LGNVFAARSIHPIAHVLILTMPFVRRIIMMIHT